MSKKIDFDKLKIFGYNRYLMKYHIYDPSKLRYFYSIKHGYVVSPKNCKSREIKFLKRNFYQAQIYEKLFNPMGFKLKLTSNFPQLPQEEKFPNFNLLVQTSEKPYTTRQLKFIIDMDMDKLKLYQILTKVYGLNVLHISTAILPGRVKRINDPKKIGFKRTADRKVAVVDIDHVVPKTYIKFQREKQEDDKKKNKDTSTLNDVIPAERKSLYDLKNIKTLEDVKEYLKQIKS